MRGQEHAGEPARTTPCTGRTPVTTTDLDVFRAHYGEIVAFTEGLKARRCRRTRHFDADLKGTVSAFQPLFAPWNMEIAFLLYMAGPLRFNALKRTLTGVSSRVLTDKLRHLAAHGFVTREEDGDAVTYALTAHGHAVARILHPLVFYLHNADALGPLDAAEAPGAATDLKPGATPARRERP